MVFSLITARLAASILSIASFSIILLFLSITTSCASFSACTVVSVFISVSLACRSATLLIAVVALLTVLNTSAGILVADSSESVTYF